MQIIAGRQASGALAVQKTVQMCTEKNVCKFTCVLYLLLYGECLNAGIFNVTNKTFSIFLVLKEVK